MVDQLDEWKTQAEAAEILKCSQRTIGRMAGQKKIQRILRRVPGRKPMPVFNPDDIEALRAGSGADRIVGAIRPGVRRGEAAYAAMT